MKGHSVIFTAGVLGILVGAAWAAGGWGLLIASPFAIATGLGVLVLEAAARAEERAHEVERELQQLVARQTRTAPEKGQEYRW